MLSSRWYYLLKEILSFPLTKKSLHFLIKLIRSMFWLLRMTNFYGILSSLLMLEKFDSGFSLHILKCDSLFVDW